MRTRSQPKSPSGFQSLETPTRRKKAQASTATATATTTPTAATMTASKVTKPKTESKKPGKRGPKKTQRKSPTKKKTTTTQPVDERADGTPGNVSQCETSASPAPEQLAGSDNKSKHRVSSQSSSGPGPADSRSASISTPASVTDSFGRSPLNDPEASLTPPIPRRHPGLSPLRLSPAGPYLSERSRSFSSPFQMPSPNVPAYSPEFGSAAVPDQDCYTSPYSIPSSPYVTRDHESVSGSGGSYTNSFEPNSSLRSRSRYVSPLVGASHPVIQSLSGRQERGLNYGAATGHLAQRQVNTSPTPSLDLGSLDLGPLVSSPRASASTARRPPTPAPQRSVRLDGSLSSLRSSRLASPAANPPLHSSPPVPLSHLNPVEATPRQSPMVATPSSGSSDTTQYSPFPLVNNPTVILNRPGRLSAIRQIRYQRTGTTPPIPRAPAVRPSHPAVPETKSVSAGTQTFPNAVSAHPSLCPCCHMVLMCPKGHSQSYYHRIQANKEPRLTENTAANIKRRRQETNDDDIVERASKRRTTRAAAVAQHRRQNVVPSAERRRRRAVESKGRIDKTVYRIPQLIAQNQADRDSADKENEDPSADQEPAWDVLRQMRADGELLEQQEEEPQPPQTPTRGWNIRGLITSVPRSITRLMPTFMQSPERQQPPPAPIVPIHDAVNTQTPSVEATEAAESSDLSDEEPSQHDMSYALFPRPLNRAEIMPDLVKKPTPRAPMPTTQPATEATAVSTPKPTIETPKTTLNGPDGSEDAGRTGKSRKRRRSPTPDIIPNPPGCSYGLHPDYFEYSELDDSSSVYHEAQENLQPPPQPAIRGILRSRKRVRFDASPEDAPSKLRLRNNSMEQPPHSFTSPQPSFMESTSDSNRASTLPSLQSLAAASFMDSTSDSNSASTQPSLRSLVATSSVPSSSSQPSVNFPQPEIDDDTPVTNTTGTYGFSYDDWSTDEEDEDELMIEAGVPTEPAQPSQPPSVPPEPSRPTPSNVSQTPLRVQNWTRPPPPRPTPAHASLPIQSTPVDSEALAKLRSKVDKYKPRLPSGLRASRRLSSSPLVEEATRPGVAASQFDWPEPQSYGGSLGVRPEIGRLVSETWTDEDTEAAYGQFSRQFDRYRSERQLALA
ncbi:hypothetical protein AJ80_07328 [Polytolypa hystricis UAMH7299]|uniref:Uncharacterized protein n=1 Tax=Polytolypa hystricis (strain UAMH7299) TaxID=1447883 RepID=A0A2B7XNZ5_POLH7|nr:hypothetical protein AJ80_07328 [Polytolypa hystricis UAMH7299]